MLSERAGRRVITLSCSHRNLALVEQNGSQQGFYELGCQGSIEKSILSDDFLLVPILVALD